MKGLIVFDSYFGNTKSVADAIAEQARAEGHEVEVVCVRDGKA
jgi:flavodoxin